MRATKLRHAPTEGARLQGLRMIAHGGRTDTWPEMETGLSPPDVVPDVQLFRPPRKPDMHTTIDRLRIRSLAALVAIAIVLAACSAPASGGSAPGTSAPGTGASPAPAAPTTGGGYSY